MTITRKELDEWKLMCEAKPVLAHRCDEERDDGGICQGCHHEDLALDCNLARTARTVLPRLIEAYLEQDYEVAYLTKTRTAALDIARDYVPTLAALRAENERLTHILTATEGVAFDYTREYQIAIARAEKAEGENVILCAEVERLQTDLRAASANMFAYIIERDEARQRLADHATAGERVLARANDAERDLDACKKHPMRAVVIENELLKKVVVQARLIWSRKQQSTAPDVLALKDALDVLDAKNGT